MRMEGVYRRGTGLANPPKNPPGFGTLNRAAPVEQGDKQEKPTWIWDPGWSSSCGVGRQAGHSPARNC